MTTLAESLAGMKPEVRAKREAEDRAGYLASLAAITAENLGRGPFPCDCGRGPVTTFVGCADCHHEMAGEYLRTLQKEGA